MVFKATLVNNCASDGQLVSVKMARSKFNTRTIHAGCVGLM